MRKYAAAWLLAAGLLLAAGCAGAKKPAAPAAAEKPGTSAEAVKPGTEVIPATPAAPAAPAAPAVPAAPAAPTGKPGGHLTADRMSYDFGQVDPGQKVEGTFVLTNDGTAPVEITNVGTSCGCTATQLKTKSLAPGASTPLGVTYTAAEYPGKTMKKLWVDVAAPSQPAKLTMSIEAEVKKSIESKPDRYIFELRDSPKNAIPLELRSLDGKPFGIAEVTCNNQVVEMTFDPNARAASFTLPIKVNLEKLRTTRAGSVNVKLVDAKIQHVVVQFGVVMPFEVKPAVRNFRNLSVGKEEKAEFTVVSNYGAPFELGTIRSQEGLLKVVKTSKTGEGYQIEVVLTPPADTTKKVFNDYLFIEIKDHPADSLRVQCYGRIGGIAGPAGPEAAGPGARVTPEPATK